MRHYPTLFESPLALWKGFHWLEVRESPSLAGFDTAIGLDPATYGHRRWTVDDLLDGVLWER